MLKLSMTELSTISGGHGSKRRQARREARRKARRRCEKRCIKRNRRTGGDENCVLKCAGR